MKLIFAAFTFFIFSPVFAAEKETPKRSPNAIQQDSPNQAELTGQRTTWAVTCPENIIAMIKSLTEKGFELNDRNDRNYSITNYSGTEIITVDFIKGDFRTQLYIQPGAGCVLGLERSN